MAHATITDLAERLAWSDLAEAAAPDVSAIDGEALRTYLTPSGTRATSFRFDSLAALREFGTFIEDGLSSRGRWELIEAGQVISNFRGPGLNSARPYVASDSSGGTLTEVSVNSPIDLAVEMNWAAATGRVLRLRCAVIGRFSGTIEGLLVQGMATGSTWETISLIRGWTDSSSYSAGDDMTDYDGATITCTQDGGWADFDIAIPDAHDEVRLRVTASGVSPAEHDVALWSAELRTVPTRFEEPDLERAVGRIQRALEDASSEVDGYLVGRYGTLATPVPDVVVTRVLDVATFRLLGGARETDRYQVWRAAMGWLEGVAAGKIDLYPPAEVEGDVRYTSRPSAFDRDTLRGL